MMLIKTIIVIISSLCSLRGRQLLVDNKGGHTMKVLLLFVAFFVCVTASEEKTKKADPAR